MECLGNQRALTLTLQESRMPQIQGVEGEAVVIYRELSTTQEVRYHRLSPRVNKMAVFPSFLDISCSELENIAQKDCKDGLLLVLRTFGHVVYATLGLTS